MSKPISQRAYAQHRGVHHSTVSKAVREGRLKTSLTSRNQIRSIAEADLEWSQTTRYRPSQQPQSRYERTVGTDLDTFDSTPRAELVRELLDHHCYARELVRICLEHFTAEELAARMRPLIGEELPPNVLALLEYDVFTELDRRDDELAANETTKTGE